MKRVLEKMIYVLLVLGVVLICVPIIADAFHAEYETEDCSAVHPMSQTDGEQHIIYDSVEYMSKEEALDYIETQLALKTKSFTVNFWMDKTEYNEDPNWLYEYVTGLKNAVPSLMGSDGYFAQCEGHVSPPTISENVCYYSLEFWWGTGLNSEKEAELDAKVTEILAELDVWNASDYEKVKAVYHYIRSHVLYDYEGAEDMLDGNWEHTAYGALINEKAVCDGCADALDRLLSALNVDCVVVYGFKGEAHAWNIVGLNGLYYIVDATGGADLLVGFDDNFLEIQAETPYTWLPYYFEEEWLSAYPMATERYLESCSGTYSNGIAWELDAETRILTVTGQGEIPDDLPMWDTWRQFRRAVKGVVVGEGITSIGYGAFEECRKLSWVQFPNTLNHIAERAFTGCPITKLELPEGVESIGSCAFFGGAFETLTLPSTLTLIGEFAFDSCENLRELTIKGDMTTVGRWAFTDCQGLRFVHICGTLNGVQDQAFSTWSEMMGSVYFDREDVAANVTNWGSLGSICNNAVSIAIPATATPSVFIATNFTVLSEITYDGLDYILYSDHICSWAAYTEGDGSRRYCTICDARKDINLAEHSYTAAVTEPGCYAGYTTYTCTQCGDCYIDHYTAALGHSFGEWEVTVPNSCTEDGVETHTCMVCGAEEERILEKNHAWSDWYVTVEVGCGFLEQNGEERRDCENCGYCETQVIYANDHIFTIVVTPVTCTTDGYTTYSCVCGTVATTDIVEAVGHDYAAVVTKPTCTKKGYTTHTCTVCGDSYEDDFVRPLNHTDVPGEILREPTCTEGGMQAYSCSVCGKEWEESLPATGHSLGEWYTYAEAGCYELGHNGEQRKDCVNCDYYESRVINAMWHVESYSVVVAPTCETSGRTEWYCECGYFLHYTDEVEPTWHANAILTKISEPTCTEWGQVYMFCPDCGYVGTPFKYGAPTGHHYVGGTCRTCGEKDASFTDPDCTVTAQTLYERMMALQAQYPEGASWTSDDYYAWNGGFVDGGYGSEGFAFMLSDAAFGTLGAVEVSGITTIEEICVGDILRMDNDTRSVIVLEVYEDYVVVAEGDYNGTVHWGRIITADQIAENTDYYLTRYPGHTYTYEYTDPTCTTVGVVIGTCTVCGDTFTSNYGSYADHEFVDGVCVNCGQEDLSLRNPDCGVTAQVLYERMMALQEAYPEGMEWTNDDYYAWYGGIYAGGYGCAGFAFMLSDAAFGTLPAVKIDGQVTIDQVRVGDILRVMWDMHSVIVLEVHEDYIVIAEGNYNSSIHWGRTMTAEEIAHSSVYRLTRYPEHSYEQTVTAPTCTGEGYTTHTCTTCGDEYVDTYVDANGHTEVIDEAVTPTCTTTGLTEGKHCSACGEVLVAQKQIAMTEHNYNAVVTDPTCTENGYTTHTCSACGAAYTDSHADALGHNHEEVVTAPTCTEDGCTTYTCHCGDTYTEVIPATGHGNTHLENAKDATCGADGYTGDTVCDKCGETVETGTVISATGDHKYGDWVVITEPTAEESGLRERTCKNCGHAEQEAMAPIAAILGDVNGDGRVNTRDARLLLRYLAGMAEESELDLAAADFNGDGRLNVRDARAILNYIAGLN